MLTPRQTPLMLPETMRVSAGTLVSKRGETHPWGGSSLPRSTRAVSGSGQLSASEKTIKTHRGQLMRKMHAESLADLVRMFEHLKLASLKS